MRRETPPIGVAMIPRIKIVEAREDFKLFVQFDDGREVMYDVKEDIAVIPDLKPLKTTRNRLRKEFMRQISNIVLNTSVLFSSTI